MSLENTRQLPKEIQARQLPFQEIICTETQYIRQIGLLIAVSKNNNNYFLININVFYSIIYVHYKMNLKELLVLWILKLYFAI